MAKQLRTGKVFIDWSQNVYYKTTSLDNIQLYPDKGPNAGAGSLFMSKLGFAINNVTSTKQTVTGASGIVVLASHDNEASVDTLQADYYFHNYINLGGAVVTPTPTRTASPTATVTPTPVKPTATPTIGPGGVTKPRVYVSIVVR